MDKITCLNSLRCPMCGSALRDIYYCLDGYTIKFEFKCGLIIFGDTKSKLCRIFDETTYCRNSVQKERERQRDLIQTWLKQDIEEDSD